MKHRIILSALVLGALGACSTTSQQAAPATEAATESAPAPDPATVEHGRELTRLFYEGELETLWERMSEQMHEGFGSIEGLAEFREQVEVQAGNETEVIEERTAPHAPFMLYMRKASFTKVGMPILVQWAVDGEGKVFGFMVHPAQ